MNSEDKNTKLVAPKIELPERWLSQTLQMLQEQIAAQLKVADAKTVAAETTQKELLLENSKLLARISALSTEIDKLKGDLGKRDNQIDLMKAESEKRIADLESKQAKQLTDRKTEADKQISLLEKRLENETSRNEKRFTEQEARIKTERERVANQYEARIKMLTENQTKQLEKITNDLTNRYEREIKSLNDAHDKEVTALRSSLKRKEAEALDAENTIRAQQTEIRQLRAIDKS